MANYWFDFCNHRTFKWNSDSIFAYGVSGLLTGLLLKLQENGTLSNLIDSWSSALIFWAVVSLALSLLLNFVVKKKQVTKDVNDY